jgi:Ran GTPase-activating protein (RanGAP) involved in mRNA processing and transport
MNFSNLNLSSTNVRPIMKSLQHQSILSEINLTNNLIQNDGIKFLAQTLSTLKCLNSLNISGNMITEVGVEFLTNILSKSQFPSEIKALNLSFNPIKSNSLRFISEICKMKNVQVLEMVSCDLSTVDYINDMKTVKHVNLSYNHFTSSSLSKFFNKLNASNIEKLNLEQCSNEFQLGEVICDFIQSGSYLSLIELNLCGLELNENEILDIFRCIDKCQKLKVINLSKMKRLTFLSVKYLLYSLDCVTLEKIVLLNCPLLRNVTNLDSLKPSNNVTTHRNLNRNLKQIQLSLPRDMSIKTEFVDSLKEFWGFLCEGHDKIEETKTILFLSRDDERTCPN